ncbi:hypothetical protein LQ764DRAFT_235445 [Zygosaccharomyces rouxii]|nr:hypothetical protein LQ764DRAFT_235445 [Zygosaccharomyces rouxii]
MTTREIILIGDDIDNFFFEIIMWTYMTPGNDQYFYDEFVAFALAPFINQGLKLKGEGIVLRLSLVQGSKFPIWNL